MEKNLLGRHFMGEILEWLGDIGRDFINVQKGREKILREGGGEIGVRFYRCAKRVSAC